MARGVRRSEVAVVRGRNKEGLVINMNHDDLSRDIHRDGLLRGWPRPSLGQTIACAYPKDEHSDIPGAPRPCLLFDFGTKSEYESAHASAVIYGTGIHRPQDIEVRQGDGLALTLLHPKSWRSAGLHKATIFLISRWRQFDYTGEYFVPRGSTPILGRLSGHEWRAFLDILFIDGFDDEDDAAGPWRAYNGPPFGAIQSFRSSGDDEPKAGVILATPWKQADGTYVEIAPLVKRVRQHPKWIALPLKLTQYEIQGRADPKAFLTPCTIDFANAQTLPLSEQHFPNAPQWSRRRLTMQDRCYARSLWAGWQHDHPPAARPRLRSPPPGWNLPRLPNWP
jgi:hypothetical protein